MKLFNQYPNLNESASRPYWQTVFSQDVKSVNRDDFQTQDTRR